VRLGDGTADSHAKTQAAAEQLWMYTGEMFTYDAVDQAMLAAGIALVPLMIGGDEPGKEILNPVAVTIFGGLVTATLLDAFLTPVLFLLFGRKPLERLLTDEERMDHAEAF
ncbi:MAG TPA: efflux RND transporter permease subunit, partial [Hyphomicrobium sp.]|nr:efflux RND transporter permease subunit [Hyphomicrobium sp.]